MAQNKSEAIDTAYLRCQYEYAYIFDSLKNERRNDQMVLLIGKKYSKFYSYYTWQADSLAMEPDYHQKWKMAFKAAIAKDGINATNFPYRRSTFFIYKDFTSNTMTTFDDINREGYKYTDTLDAQQWEIIDSTKIILDYQCIKAETDYHGRHWIAWFATDIPVANGPWKLGGLPGLILEAYDTRNEHHFMLNGLQKVSNVPIDKMNGKYQSTTRLSFLKAKRKSFEESTGQLTELTGKSFEKAKIKRDILETDY